MKGKQEVEITAFGLREIFMDYFKGDCVQKCIKLPQVSVKSVPLPNRTRQYERRRHELHRARTLFLCDTPVAQMSLAPNTVTFYTKVLERSTEFKALHKQLRRFFKTYLKGVKVVADAESHAKYANDGQDDLVILGMSKVRDIQQSNLFDPRFVNIPDSLYIDYNEALSRVTSATNVRFYSSSDITFGRAVDSMEANF